MWFSRRRHDEASPAPEPDAARPPVVTRHDWSQLPALQRIGTGLDGVVDTGFEADLGSWHSPGILRPLDHALSQDAPSGMVLGSIARSALPSSDASSSAAGPVAQRTVMFEPPRRPTATFTPDAPRSIPAVSAPAMEAAAPLIVADVSVADAPALPATEPTPPLPADDRAGPSEVAPIEPEAPPPIDQADTVAPTLGTPGPVREPEPNPPVPDPIQRTVEPTPRPFGLGAPLPAPGSDAPAVPNAPSPTAPVQRTRRDGPAPAASAPPVVQRELLDARAGDDAPLSAAPDPAGPDLAVPEPVPDAATPVTAVAESATAPLVGDAAPGPAFDHSAVPPEPGPEVSAASTTPLLGGHPPLLDVGSDGGDEPDPAALTPTSALPVVQTRRAGLGEPWRAAPEPATPAVVQRTPALDASPAVSRPVDAGPGEPPVVGANETAPVAPPDPDPAPPTLEPTPIAAESVTAESPATAPLLSASAPILEPAPDLTAPTSEAPVSPAPGPATGSVTWTPLLTDPPGPSTATAGADASVGPGPVPTQRLAPSTTAPPAQTGGPSAPTATPTDVAPSVAPTLGTDAGGGLPVTLAAEPGRSSEGEVGAPASSDRPGGPTLPTLPAVPDVADVSAPPTLSVAEGAPADAPTSPAPAPTVVALLGERTMAPAAAPRTERASGVAVQRLAGEPAPAVPSRPARASAPASPRVADRGTTTSWSTQRAVSWVDAGSVAVEAGVAQREADGSVVFQAGAFEGPEADVDAGDGEVVQRAAATGATSTPAAPGAARGADSGDLDELAKRLYGRLRVMLKHELRLDRERAGVLTQGRR